MVLEEIEQFKNISEIHKVERISPTRIQMNVKKDGNKELHVMIDLDNFNKLFPNTVPEELTIETLKEALNEHPTGYFDYLITEISDKPNK